MTYNLKVSRVNGMYFGQLLVGFELLKKQKKLDYKVSVDNSLEKEFLDSSICEILIDKKRVILNFSDGYNNFPSFKFIDDCLNNCDVFFKANVNRTLHNNLKNNEKIKPLPLRYGLIAPSSIIDLFSNQESLKTKLRKLSRKLPVFYDSEYQYYYDRFEAEPIVTKEPKVFCYARVWDPNIASAKSSQNVDIDGDTVEKRIATKYEQYNELSELRAGCVRALKKEFGSRFIGGIKPEPYALEKYPDLIINKHIGVKKKNYTKALQGCEICVQTHGTHFCWNWGTGEAVAASRALVTQSPYYDIPPHLAEGKNMVFYNTPDECVEQVAKLFDDKEKLQNMMLANRRYYLEHLRPDKIVLDILKTIQEL